MRRGGSNWQPDGYGASPSPETRSPSLASTTPPSIEPLRFGLKHEPPSLVLEYRRGRQLRHYVIHLKERDLEKDASQVARKLMRHHADYLNPHCISTEQLGSLIGRLQKPASQASTTASTKTASTDNNKSRQAESSTLDRAGATGRYGDLNKVSERELRVAKDTMNIDFEANRLRPDDPNYEWDKQVDFRPEEPSDWDEDDDDF